MIMKNHKYLFFAGFMFALLRAEDGYADACEYCINPSGYNSPCTLCPPPTKTGCLGISASTTWPNGPTTSCEYACDDPHDNYTCTCETKTTCTCGDKDCPPSSFDKENMKEKRVEKRNEGAENDDANPKVNIVFRK
jgi:hypothetical protein